MKRILIALTVVAGLSACGVDGEPVKPDVNAGVTITPNGVVPTAGVSIPGLPIGIRLAL